MKPNKSMISNQKKIDVVVPLRPKKNTDCKELSLLEAIRLVVKIAEQVKSDDSRVHKAITNLKNFTGDQ